MENLNEKAKLLEEKLLLIHNSSDTQDVRHEEFRALVDVYLPDHDEAKIAKVEEIQREFLIKQNTLFQASEPNEYSFIHEQSKLLAKDMFSEIRDILGKDDFQTLFGMSVDECAGVMDRDDEHVEHEAAFPEQQQYEPKSPVEYLLQIWGRGGVLDKFDYSQMRLWASQITTARIPRDRHFRKIALLLEAKAGAIPDDPILPSDWELWRNSYRVALQVAQMAENTGLLDQIFDPQVFHEIQKNLSWNTTPSLAENVIGPPHRSELPSLMLLAKQTVLSENLKNKKSRMQLLSVAENDLTLREWSIVGPFFTGAALLNAALLIGSTSRIYSLPFLSMTKARMSATDVIAMSSFIGSVSIFQAMHDLAKARQER